MTAIRQMLESDLEKVLALLEATFPYDTFSKEWWDWKYRRNPCGTAILLVAEEGSEIIGLRAFWPRIFVKSGEQQTVYQATDTAVHPGARRRGIFSSLTKKGLALVRSRGGKAIFNFPNPKSAPGYLKLGWKDAGKLSWWVRMIPGSGIRKAPLKCTSVSAEHSFPASDTIRTGFLKDSEFVRWRYEDHPSHTYEFWDMEGAGAGTTVVTRKIRRKGIHIRVLIDMLGESASDPVEARRLLSQMTKRIPTTPFHPLCVLDSSFAQATAATFLRKFYFRVPDSGVNYYVRECGDHDLSRALSKTAIVPGDTDTF